MATGYQGYSSYGDPERAKVDRHRRLAEMLQEGALDTGPKSMWEGVAQLGKAFIARDSMNQLDKAEAGYADSRRKAADLFISQMYPETPAISGGATSKLSADGSAFETTPGTAPVRQPQRADKVRSLAELLGGDLAGAMQLEQSMQPERITPFQEAQLELDRQKPFVVNDRVLDRNDPTKVIADYSDGEDPSDIRQVGNSIVQRQQDGSWKPVYTGSSPAETARAFQGFIDQGTGEQMLVMSDGSVKGTGRTAYVPPQITSVGGVPTAVDKRTYETTQLSPLAEAAGNKAAMSSAEVQGKAQGEAAFNLPTIEMRSQAAINSISDLRGRNIGARFGTQGMLYAIPGTEGADVQAMVDQVTSQAFLNAFDQLRGAGAITEREGQAATQAITRLQNRSITIGEAMKAMDELQSYYGKGLEVARQKASQGPTLPGAASTYQPKPQAITGRATNSGVGTAQKLQARVASKATGIQEEAIAELMLDPEGAAAEFDEAFGPGMAQRVLGGQF